MRPFRKSDITKDFSQLRNKKTPPDDGVDRSDPWVFGDRCECGREDCQDHVTGHSNHMIRKEVWEDAGLHPRQIINPNCLEKILGRELTKKDIRLGDLNVEKDLKRKLKQ